MRRTMMVVVAGAFAVTLGTAAHADCRTDTDCKANRVCVSGKCKEPPAGQPPPPAAAPVAPTEPAPPRANPVEEGCRTDAECKGGRVCETGKCVQTSAARMISQ